jgi:hypothetical protein
MDRDRHSARSGYKTALPRLTAFNRLAIIRHREEGAANAGRYLGL